MSLRRVHLPPERIGAEAAALTPEARHYLRDVLRLAPGAAVELFDGAGGAWRATIDAAFEQLTLGARREARPALRLTLLVALAKGEKLELVVQKATELGATDLFPFAAERSVVKLDGEKGEARAERWRRIAEEAARQCGRADVPRVAAPGPLEAALQALPPGCAAFVFHPGGQPLPPLSEEGGPGLVLTPGGVAAVVGPEGGLTDREVEACERTGARRATLGPRILRAETAALVAAALLQSRYGDLG
ncbi:MAG: 16S rRNA (uracil(1498)-N(3))-methyltransferase [Anaeromyxobacter sp.]